jgi:hypothetical protein
MSGSKCRRGGAPKHSWEAFVTIAISQPTFLPWLGYFDLIARADIFVLLDIVQFEKQSWQSRNRIRTTQGHVSWLSVPVSNAPLSTLLKDVQVASSPSGWRRKQAKTIEQQLGRAPFFGQAESIYLATYSGQGFNASLADMNTRFIMAVSEALDLKTRLVRASELPVHGSRTELLLALCRHFSATTYYSNAGSAVYLETSRPRFADVGVEIVYQDWKHPEYQQVGPGFVSHLSCIDAIACLGIDATAAAVNKAC